MAQGDCVHLINSEHDHIMYGIPGGTLRGEGKTARGDQRGAISEGKTARGDHCEGRGVRGEGREARSEGRGASVSSEMRELSREGTSDVQQRLAIILYSSANMRILEL